MAEWTNPIFYLNLFGFIAGLIILIRGRTTRIDDDEPTNPWWALAWVLTIATGLHFIGDLAGVSEDLDHVFIHGAVMVALAIPAVALLRRA